jgi:hypothetical protein
VKREVRDNRRINGNPLQSIAVLINQYHSIDLMPASKEDKEFTKQRIVREINEKMINVSKDIHPQLKASIKSKRVWEEFRNTIL